MATVTIPFTFVNNTQNADATQVNSNFSTLASFINTEVIQRDASVAFTQIPTLPATTPTLANHATRKGYVDSFFPVTSANIQDGTIMNIDINASAAIDKTKLNLAGTLGLADFGATAKPVVICTSSTRPSPPVDGQVVYETDKDRVMVYDGSGWAYVSGLVGATVSGSAAIPNANTFNLSYSTETLDTDSMIAASGNTFTVPFSGTYALTIDVTAPSDMAAGLGSNLILTAGTRTMDARLWSTSSAVTLIVPLTASQTAKFQITNGTGAALTYTYETILRLIGN